ncbi:MAG: response regulator [Methyloceanibacter sp.]|uniref:response regulator n=1 Tax=Methyloceanibacter sp. TaxID=1965321 RepID=UPI003EDF1EE7
MPRILVVDDEPLISMMVEDWLTELGCEVVGPARSVADGIEFATAAALDGAILDICLGDGDSYPLARALLSRGIPFAFATGQGDGSLDADFENQLVLMKPFDFASVQDVVGKLLASRVTP